LRRDDRKTRESTIRIGTGGHRLESRQDQPNAFVSRPGLATVRLPASRTRTDGIMLVTRATSSPLRGRRSCA
jgi:hypothetical protein